MAASSGFAKKSILDLNKHLDARVRVKFAGGREVVGVLKGYDQLVNLVLDEAVETLRNSEDLYSLSEKTRNLGVTVCRGSAIILISQLDGTEEITNPFLQNEE